MLLRFWRFGSSLTLSLGLLQRLLRSLPLSFLLPLSGLPLGLFPGSFLFLGSVGLSLGFLQRLPFLPLSLFLLLPGLLLLLFSHSLLLLGSITFSSSVGQRLLRFLPLPPLSLLPFLTSLQLLLILLALRLVPLHPFVELHQVPPCFLKYGMRIDQFDSHEREASCNEKKDAGKERSSEGEGPSQDPTLRRKDEAHRLPLFAL